MVYRMWDKKKGTEKLILITGKEKYEQKARGRTFFIHSFIHSLFGQSLKSYAVPPQDGETLCLAPDL